MLFKEIADCGLVPVIKINDPAKAMPLANALREGGINCAEITFRTAAARAAIETIAKELPDMLLGAGTVISLDQLRSARDAGAKFIVSPGLSVEIVKNALKTGLDVIPGIVTPTELMTGLELGLEVFKFFPSETFGGLKAILALAAPFGNVKFVPTGGIDENNAAEYWKCPKVLAIGGSWVATEKLIDNDDYAEITRRCKNASELMRNVREAL